MQTPDPRPGFYYVSVRSENGDFRLLRGPFVDDHAAALAAVDAARERACKMDRRAWFYYYYYGTCRTATDSGPGIFDRLDAETAK